jgi:predicted enzyme related to lactoylglutathione lyase
VLDSAELVAFVGSRDLEVSARFYGGVLGLDAIESSPHAEVFDANGTDVRVTRVEQVAPAGHTVLGWKVDDIVAAIEALAGAGVTFNRYDGLAQDEHGVWTAPGGSRIAWFSDPDGNILSLQQPPQ